MCIRDSYITLRSTQPGVAWYLNNTSGNFVDYVDVSSSNAEGGLTIYAGTNSINSGGNLNWVFDLPLDTGVRYWVAASTGDWSNTANWSYASGSRGGASVPMSTNTVVFNSVGDGNCVVDEAVAVATISVSGYTGVLKTEGFSVSISSDYVQLSGTVELGTSAVTLQGDFTQTAGTFIAGASTVTFSGTQEQTLRQNSADFFNVVIDKAGGSLTLGDPVTVGGNLTLQAGTLNSSTGTLGVGGNFVHTGGVFNHRNGEALLRGEPRKILEVSGGAAFNNLKLGSGLVGYWKLDDGSGTTEQDYTGKGKEGTLHYETF